MKPVGLIPAHAGKTVSFDFLPFPARAHPRSRGENVELEGHVGDVLGSSPLTRGKLEARRRALDLAGLIPAHAGKTNNARRMAPPLTAHPRSRGENIDHVPCIISYPGSSPLTRGKPPESAEVHTWIRLIPAHAGKTRPSRMPVMEVRAHPRSRGENQHLASVF